MSEVALYLSDNLIEWAGAKNVATGGYLNAATVLVTLVDKNGSTVAGQAWPMTMVYVVASNGKYRATLVSTLGVSRGETCIAKISFDAGAGLRRYSELPVRFVVDGGRS